MIDRYRKGTVLVPFYRGAVVFCSMLWICKQKEKGFLPLLSRAGVFQGSNKMKLSAEFSSPFIEERLYLNIRKAFYKSRKIVLVPFYRGAVVFAEYYGVGLDDIFLFSSPFIEERLYFYWIHTLILKTTSSRPLLSRSGCIFLFG